jgi:replication factor A1
MNANALSFRVRYQVMSAAPIDFKSEGNKLAELIKQYNINE